MTKFVGLTAALLVALPATAGANSFSFTRLARIKGLDTVPVNTQAPVIPTATGRYVGVPITVAAGVWSSGAPTKAWVSCATALTAAASCTPITNATGSSYTPVAGDVGKYLRFRERVTYTGGSVDGFSNAVGPVLAVPSNTALPVITAASIRLTSTAITFTAGRWTSGTPSKTWVRCTSATLANSCTDIAGATLATYTPGPLDVGKYIRVRETVTYATSSVSALSAAVGPVIALPVNSAAPVIVAAASRTIGTPIVATAGTWSTGTPAKAWMRCPTSTTAGVSCAVISGATSSSYTPQVADVGKYIRFRETVTYGGSLQAIAYSAAVGAVTYPIPVNTILPAVSSSDSIQVVGTVLTATAGTWTNGPAAKAWVACTSATLTSACAPISGATAASFTATSAQVGKYIRMRETVTNPSWTKVVFSAAVGPVLALPTRSTRYPQGFIGTNMDPMDLEHQIGRPDVINEIRLAVEAGVERIRFPVYWSNIQPYQPRAGHAIFYDWARLDWIISTAAEKGVALMPTLIGAPDWASRDLSDQSPGTITVVPSRRHYGDFANFAKAAAARYGNTSSAFWTAWKRESAHRSTTPVPVKIWQIWNEPDHPKFWPAQYTEDTASSPTIACSSSVSTLPTEPAGTTVENLVTNYKTTGLTNTDKASKCYDSVAKKLIVSWSMKLRASGRSLPCTSTWSAAPLAAAAGAIRSVAYKTTGLTSADRASKCYVSSGNKLITSWTTSVTWGADYAAMLRAAKAGILAGDPTAKVMLSSFTSAGATSAASLYAGIAAIKAADSSASGPSKFFDQVGINVFPSSAPTSVKPYHYKFENPAESGGYPAKIKSFMDVVAAQDKGRTVPAYLTEFGWQSGRCDTWLTGSMLSRCNSDRMPVSSTGIFTGSWLTRDDQAALAAASLGYVGDTTKNTKVQGVLWFTWMSSDSGKSSVWEYSGLRCFGCDAYSKSGSSITRTDYRTYTKPAYDAFKRTALVFEGCYVLRGMTRQYTTKPVAARCSK